MSSILKAKKGRYWGVHYRVNGKEQRVGLPALSKFFGGALPESVQDEIRAVFRAGRMDDERRKPGPPKAGMAAPPTDTTGPIDGEPCPPPTEAIKKFCTSLRKQRRSANTVSIRLSNMSVLHKAFGDDWPDWMRFWDFVGGLKRNSRMSFIATKNVFHRWARQNGYVLPPWGAGKPAAKSVQQKTEDEETVKPDLVPREVLAGLQQVVLDAGPRHRVGNKVVGMLDWMSLVAAMLTYSPLDPADIHAMDWAGIEWEDGPGSTKIKSQVWYRGRRKKTGEQINLPLPRRTVVTLLHLWNQQGKPEEGPVQPDMPSVPETWRKALGKLEAAAGIPRQKGAAFKKYRHSFATYIELTLGAPAVVADRLMGHKTDHQQNGNGNGGASQRMARVYQRIEQLDELTAKWMHRYANWIETGDMEGRRT